MSKHKWLWVLLFILLLSSAPSLVDRWQAEGDNNTYELMVPYKEIYELTTDSTLTIDEILSSLKTAGLNTVSLNPLSLKSMEERDIVTVYSKAELEAVLRFQDMEDDLLPIKEGHYITIPDLSYYEGVIESNFSPIKTTISGETLYFIPAEDTMNLTSTIGYNQMAMEKLQQHDLNYVLRVENDTSGQHKEINQKTVDRLIQWKSDATSNLLFTGQDVIGYPDQQQITNFAKQLSDAGYQFYTIEFTTQRGLSKIARYTDYEMIRLHSIDLDNKTLEENVDQAIRAVKERNIRSVFFHIQNGEPAESFKSATEFVASVHQEMPAHFEAGTPQSFLQVQTPIWIQITLLAAGVIFTFLASGMINNFKLRIASAVFMAVLALCHLLLHSLISLQAFALIIAVFTPVYAVLATKESSGKIRDITFQFIKTLGISFIGIILVVGLLNGNAFMTGFELFRGVKVVYIVPILAIALFLLWREGLKLLNMNVRYWHAAIILLLGAAGLYYITRTGNAGTVSEIEIMVRSTLEELLYVRPRTKEFLIGFPFYILALYVISFHRIWGKILLVPGVVGFLSIVNTFTHFHVPLHISLLRTAYSVLIGYLLGLLLIYILFYVYRFYRRRWT
ncbi:DUF5693 family protein [Lentibacillus sediminis]|uniref:DUF5693 family protein n=1 Tax=Lentibacillus sediminis TaxID=1940529 RepID=UPI00117BA998|nr:DUF5693 family protein [Lentibacillus sediminis]